MLTQVEHRRLYADVCDQSFDADDLKGRDVLRLVEHLDEPAMASDTKPVWEGQVIAASVALTDS